MKNLWLVLFFVIVDVGGEQTSFIIKENEKKKTFICYFGNVNFELKHESFVRYLIPYNPCSREA